MIEQGEHMHKCKIVYKSGDERTIIARSYDIKMAPLNQIVFINFYNDNHELCNSIRGEEVAEVVKYYDKSGK